MFLHGSDPIEENPFAHR